MFIQPPTTQSNEELSHRLDMESHCVLIVGYNDDKEEFDIVDPWNPNWGGQHGGVGKLPYESLHVACVNCTAEKGTRLSLISHKIRPVLIEENASLAVDLGFYEPLGYVIDRNNTKFETFKVTIHYLFNGKAAIAEPFWRMEDWGKGDIYIPFGKRTVGRYRCQNRGACDLIK